MRVGGCREPVIWVVLAIVARGVAEIGAFVLLDQDLIKHDRAEVGAEYELSLIYRPWASTCVHPIRTG